jgi:pyroglutamyl-peptidase
MRILITAFEPFGSAESNITQSILSLLPDSLADWAIEKVCLPVSFKRAPIVLREAITTYSPDLVIMLGQCPAGENIRLERFAINMMDSTKGDNDGYIPNEETIYANHPLALQTPLPIKELDRFCTDHVQPVQVSNSAGLYVCNRMYYEALYLQKQAIFVHVPKNMDVILVLRTIIQVITKLSREYEKRNEE